jgi:hypothetical protein
MGDIKKNNVQKFIKYMARPLSLLAIDLIYTSNNIVYERVDLYRDFTLTLDDLIQTTYLGHELTEERERLNHFNWCWDKASELITQKNIKFVDNNHAYVYFLDYYFDTFYSNKINDFNISDFWSYIFNYNIEKSRSDLDSFINLYKILEKSYKKD